MTARPSTFASLLRAELTRRCAGNPAYSLRAFARDLAIDHATLSQLIRGRREMTAETVDRLADKLQLAPATRAAFLADIRLPPTNEHATRPTREAVDILAEPLHHAILALVTNREFRADSRLVAQMLDVTVDAVNVAVQRLARFGLLQLENAQWIDKIGLGHLDPDCFEQAVWAYTTRRLQQDEERVVVADEGEPPVSRCCPVRQFQIVARDPDKVAEFYQQLFAWQIDDANGLGYRQISTGQLGIDGGIWPAPPQAQAFVQLFVEVDDLVIRVEHATRLGAQVLLAPQTLPDGDQMAVLRDPDGLAFAMYQRRSL